MHYELSSTVFNTSFRSMPEIFGRDLRGLLSRADCPAETKTDNQVFGRMLKLGWTRFGVGDTPYSVPFQDRKRQRLIVQ